MNWGSRLYPSRCTSCSATEGTIVSINRSSWEEIGVFEEEFALVLKLLAELLSIEFCYL